jgi:outer membrane protein
VKKSILFVLILFTVSAFAQTQPAQTTLLKLGWVDSQIILAQLPEAIKAKADLEGMVSKWRKDLDSMQTDYQKFLADNQKQAETMKKDDLQKVQQKLAEKEQKYTQYNTAKFAQPNGELYQQQDQLLSPVKAKIYKAIDEISKDLGMQFVFDKAIDGVLAKADAEFDITYKVLDYLKRGKK